MAGVCKHTHIHTVDRLQKKQCLTSSLTQSHRSDGEQNEQVPLEETSDALPADGAHPLLHAARSPLHDPAKAPPQVSSLRHGGLVRVLVQEKAGAVRGLLVHNQLQHLVQEAGLV